MSNPLGRIGKSLIKYFKPVRVALPHQPEKKKLLSPDAQSGGEDPSSQDDPSSGTFKLLKFKKPLRDKVAESKVLTRSGYDPIKEAGLDEPQLPEKAPSHWLEMVTYLLTACRKVSTLMKRKAGVEVYRKAVLAKGSQKLQTVGSIVNTTSVILEEGGGDENKRDAA